MEFSLSSHKKAMTGCHRRLSLPQAEGCGAAGRRIALTRGKYMSESAEEWRRALFEKYVDGVALVVEGLVEYINPALARMSGYSAGEARGRAPPGVGVPGAPGAPGGPDAPP